MTTSHEKPSADESHVADSKNRRGFLTRALPALLGGLAGLVPAVTGIVAFLNPLRQKGQAGRLCQVTRLDVLPEDGTPRRFPIVADRTDAWTRFADEPIGAVYLRRTGDPKAPVEALQVVCPHMGCHIEHRATAEGGEFYCPCHGASFDLAGKRKEAHSDSPRDLDGLEVDAQRLADGEVWVHFKEFQTGTARKVEKS